MISKMKSLPWMVFIFQAIISVEAQAGDIKFGVGGPNTVSYHMAMSICKVVGKKLTGDNGRCSPLVQQNQLARINRLQKGVTNFALVTSRFQYDLLRNSRLARNVPRLKKDIRAVMSLQVFPYIFLSTKKSFNSAEELLRNKGILFPRKFPIRDNDVFVQACTDCAPKCSQNCKCVDCADADDIASLKNHSGFGLILPRHQSLLKKVIDYPIARPLSFSKMFMKKYYSNRVAKKYPFLYEISAPIFSKKNYRTFGPSLTLVTMSRTSDKLVYRVTKEIIGKIKEIKKIQPKNTKSGNLSLTPRQMSRAGLTATLHKGAEKLFKEKKLL